jgi:hypothetical protein
MNNQNVIALPASTSFTPEQALESAKGIALTDVLIIGYDEEGALFVRSSRLTRAEALFLLEKGRDYVMYPED